MSNIDFSVYTLGYYLTMHNHQIITNTQGTLIIKSLNVIMILWSIILGYLAYAAHVSYPIFEF